MSLETILGILFFVVFFILPALAKKKPPEEGQAAPAQPPPGTTEGPGAGERAAPRQQPAAGQTGPAKAITSARGPVGPTATRPPATRGRGPLAAGSIEEALEEIRARVREAQQQEDAGRPAAPSGPSRSRAATEPPRPRGVMTGDAGEGGLVSGEARRIGDTGSRTPPAAQGGHGGAARSGPPVARRTPGALASESVSAPLEVTRRKRGAAKTLTEVGPSRASAGKRTQGAIPSTAAATARLSPPVLATDRTSLVQGMIWHVILSEPAAKRRLRRTRSRHL